MEPAGGIAESHAWVYVGLVWLDSRFFEGDAPAGAVYMQKRRECCG